MALCTASAIKTNVNGYHTAYGTLVTIEPGMRHDGGVKKTTKTKTTTTTTTTAIT